MRHGSRFHWIWPIATVLIACEQSGGGGVDRASAGGSGTRASENAPAESSGVSAAPAASQQDAAIGAGGARATSSPEAPDNAASAEAAADADGKRAPSAGGSGDPEATSSSAPGGAAAPPIDESAELYDEDSVPRFDITLPATSVAMLRADGDSYVPGELRYGDETVSDIGVRIKGSASRRTLDEKPAFKLKFDELVPDQQFRGLRRMTLNNMVEDPSFIAERLSYALFRAAGLPAPRCNSALVYVNGEPYGVYANVETEDKTFLRRWFDDEDGNLYEVAMSDFVPGAEQLFELETNEKQNDRSDLAQLIAVFSAATPDGFLDAMSPVLDLAHYLRFSAIEAAVNQWDMYSYTVFYPNNFRLYRDPSSGKFVFLPWGLDMSLKPLPATGREHIPLYALAHGNDDPAEPVTAGLLFQRCMQSAACRDRYSAAVREVLAVYERLDLEAMAERYRAQIEPYVRVDPRTPYDAEQLEAGYQKVLKTIRERPAAIRAELDP